MGLHILIPVQSLMRHPNSNITMNVYTHAVSSKKRLAQSKVCIENGFFPYPDLRLICREGQDLGRH